MPCLVSMIRIISVALALSTASAVRASLRKASASAEGQSARAGIEQKLAHVESQTSQVAADLLNAQSQITTALVELEAIVKPMPKAANQSVGHATKAAVAKNASKPAVTNAVPAKDVKTKIKVETSMMESLFKHLKSNIAKFNKEESHGKEESEKQIEKLQARLKRDKALLARTNISKFEHELLVNRTKMDESELQYQSNDRHLGHQMFHANLKMTHGLMERVKMVMEAYKEASAKGHVDPTLMKKVMGSSLPKAFVQIQATVERSARRYMAHLRLGLRKPNMAVDSM